MDEQVARTEQVVSEAGKRQAEALERSKAAIDDWAKLSKDSMTYAFALGTEWQKLAIEATRKAAEMWQLPTV